MAPIAHAMPHPPQLAASVGVLTQIEPHRVWPVGQVHDPATQDAPLGQTVPQAAQFETLFSRSTQL